MNKVKIRRLKTALRNNKLKVLIIVLVFVVATIGSGYAILNQRVGLNGNTTIGEETSNCDINITGSYALLDRWTNDLNYYRVMITIDNNSGSEIKGWTIKLKGPYDLSVQGNVDVISNIEGVLTISAQPDSEQYFWNSTIEIGGSKEVPIIFSTVESNFDPDWITFNGCKIYGKGEVDIEQDPTVELTGLEIIPDEYEMFVGETVPLQISRTPANAMATITWTSSDENIVNITENGIITAVSPGIVTITAVSGEISATSTITVVEPLPEPEGKNIHITFEEVGFWGGSTYHFKLTFQNVSEENIDSIRFDLNLPEGTSYNLWSNPGFTVTDNSFSTSNYFQTLTPNQSIELTGAITMPNNMDATDYLNPSILNIFVNR